MKYKHSKKHRNNRKKYITFVVDFKITLSFNKQLTLTSMGKYNFDQLIDRRGSRAMKIDRLEAMFGRTDLTSMWIADMDFAVCPQIIEALQERISHPIYGYSCPSDGYYPQPRSIWQGYLPEPCPDSGKRRWSRNSRRS